VLVDDPSPRPGLTPDPGDDYLVALAQKADAQYIVSGDAHLTQLTDPNPPVLTPHEFLETRNDRRPPVRRGTSRGTSVSESELI